MGALQANGTESLAGRGELPLLGRTAELSELTAALEDARAGRGGLVLLSGEPGIGKTRLARTLADQARASGAQVAWARGWDGGGAPAYWPWLQVLRDLSSGRSDERLAADLGAGARWVAQIAPEIRDRLGLADAADASESEQARFALFDAVAVFLRQQRTYRWLESRRPGVHALHLIPGYTHMDMLFGRDAARDVFPHIVRALAH